MVQHSDVQLNRNYEHEMNPSYFDSTRAVPSEANANMQAMCIRNKNQQLIHNP